MDQNTIFIGWREWLTLPDPGIKAIKAKVDTGARTSALHTFGLEPFEKDGILKVKFGVHPLQRRKDIEVDCVADVVERRVSIQYTPRRKGHHHSHNTGGTFDCDARC